MRSALPIAGLGSGNHGSQKNWFSSLANHAARLAGRPGTFLLAAGLILVWGVSGPFFNFSDTWQLVINTGTTIITFLMVFLIQNTQTRDTLALQVKLSELIVALEGARNLVAKVDDKSEEELEALRVDIQQKAEQQERSSRRGKATHRIGENRGE